MGIQMGDMRTVNQCTCRKVRQRIAVGLVICTALAALVLPGRVHAQFAGKVSATAQFESNSNVFDLESGFSPPANTSRRSDTSFAYGAGFDLSYLWDRQQLYATASTTKYEYQHFTQLDNTSYQIDAGLKWKLGELLDGKLDVARTRSMVPFFDLSGVAQELSLSTVQTETAQVGIRLSSDWKLEGSAYSSKTDQPVAGEPNLQLTQTSGTAAINYVGFTGLSSGLTAGYSTGEYGGSATTANPKYSQYTAGLAADYKHNRATFDGQIGYSKRQSDTGTDNTSGLTGAFDIKYQLTPKTSVMANVSRSINSFVVNTSSEIDTAVGAGVNWQALYKLSVYAGYTFTYRDYPGQATNTASGDRVDIQEYANLAINYEPQPWLLIKPYANVQTRRSTFVGGDFNSTVFGVSVTVTPYQRPKQVRAH
jgi:hypothetical protein